MRRLLEPAVLAKLQAEHPHLVSDPTMSGYALAAKNIRGMLKRQFPKTKFRVRCETYSSGSAVGVSWTVFDNDDPSRQAVENLVQPFVSTRFDGMTDSIDFVETDRDFRAAFGGASSVSVGHHNATAEERAARQAQQLGRTVRTPACAPRRPRI